MVDPWPVIISGLANNLSMNSLDSGSDTWMAMNCGVYHSIDKKIINEVVKMREYTSTIFSCEGHLYKKIMSSYITVIDHLIFRYMVARFNFGFIGSKDYYCHVIYCKYMDDFSITVEFWYKERGGYICIRVKPLDDEKLSQKEWDDIRTRGWNKVFEMLERIA